MRPTIRQARPKDYPELTDLYNSQNEPHHHLSEEELRRYDEYASKRSFYRRLTALVAGQVVGTAQFGERPSDDEPGKYWAWLFVHKDHGDEGVDTALHDEMLSLLAEHDPTSVWTCIREDFVPAAKYLETRSYQEQFRSWGAQLDLNKFDPDEFGHYRESLLRRGIELRTYQQLAADTQRDAKLAALQARLEDDAPHFEPIIPKRHARVNDPDTLVDSVVVAARGDEYVGLASLLKPKRFPSVPGSGLTGVARLYRNLGIATALKAQTATLAKRQGYSEINAGGAGANTPILKVNRRLGFEIGPAWITFAKIL